MAYAYMPWNCLIYNFADRTNPFIYFQKRISDIVGSLLILSSQINWSGVHLKVREDKLVKKVVRAWKVTLKTKSKKEKKVEFEGYFKFNPKISLKDNIWFFPDPEVQLSEMEKKTSHVIPSP